MRFEEEGKRLMDQACKDLGDKKLNEASVKKAYHELALKYHPDKHKGSEEQYTQTFQGISNKYNAIIDDLKKESVTERWRQQRAEAERKRQQQAAAERKRQQQAAAEAAARQRAAEAAAAAAAAERTQLLNTLMSDANTMNDSQLKQTTDQAVEKETISWQDILNKAYDSNNPKCQARFLAYAIEKKVKNLNSFVESLEPSVLRRIMDSADTCETIFNNDSLKKAFSQKLQQSIIDDIEGIVPTQDSHRRTSNSLQQPPLSVDIQSLKPTPTDPKHFPSLFHIHQILTEIVTRDGLTADTTGQHDWVQKENKKAVLRIIRDKSTRALLTSPANKASFKTCYAILASKRGEPVFRTFAAASQLLEVTKPGARLSEVMEACFEEVPHYVVDIVNRITEVNRLLTADSAFIHSVFCPHDKKPRVQAIMNLTTPASITDYLGDIQGHANFASFIQLVESIPNDLKMFRRHQDLINQRFESTCGQIIAIIQSGYTGLTPEDKKDPLFLFVWQHYNQAMRKGEAPLSHCATFRENYLQNQNENSLDLSVERASAARERASAAQERAYQAAQERASKITNKVTILDYISRYRRVMLNRESIHQQTATIPLPWSSDTPSRYKLSDGDFLAHYDGLASIYKDIKVYVDQAEQNIKAIEKMTRSIPSAYIATLDIHTKNIIGKIKALHTAHTDENQETARTLYYKLKCQEKQLPGVSDIVKQAAACRNKVDDIARKVKSLSDPNKNRFSEDNKAIIGEINTMNAAGKQKNDQEATRIFVQLMQNQHGLDNFDQEYRNLFTKRKQQEGAAELPPSQKRHRHGDPSRGQNHPGIGHDPT